MSYKFTIRSNRCDGWYQAVATPIHEGEARHSRRFNNPGAAMDAVRFFVKNGRFQSEQENADVEEVEVCGDCGRKLAPE